jgi:predicted ATPase
MKGDTPPVRIEELRLQGFRAFENARLTLGDLTVLVGRNGAGKSTLLDAFEFIRDALTDGLEIALERRGGISSLMHRGGQAKRELAIAVKLRLSSQYLEEVSVESGIDSAGWMPLREVIITYGFRLKLRRGKSGFFIKDELAEIARDGGQGVSGTYLLGPGSSDILELPSSSRWDLLLRALLKALRESIRAYNLAPSAIRAEPLIGRTTLLQRDGGNAGDVLRQLEKDEKEVAWIVRHLAAITPGIVGINAGTAAGRRVIRFLQRVGSKSRVNFNIGEMSDGTLRSLATLLALRQNPTPAIVCIDEIEESVHPAALGVLIDAALATTERCQVLLTSHSPEALSHPAVTAQSVRVIDWHEGQSRIFRLSPGAEESSRPPGSVGKLLRTNTLFTARSPEQVEGSIFGNG